MLSAVFNRISAIWLFCSYNLSNNGELYKVNNGRLLLERLSWVNLGREYAN